MDDTQTSQKRKKQLTEELDRIMPILRDDYGAEKIIAFGSFVNGSIGPWSDLDIAIIKPTAQRFIKRLIEVAHLVHPMVGIDFLVYTPEEFSQMSMENYFVHDEIAGKGKVLYEKNESE